MVRSRAPSAKDKALADLARLKRGGDGEQVSSRLASYEITEQDAVYDEVDDETYAEHAARQRAAVRDFVVRRGDGEDAEDDDENAWDNDEDDINDEAEYALEDEMSLLHSKVDEKIAPSSAAKNPRNKKRRHSSAAGRNKAGNSTEGGSRRVSAAFLGGSSRSLRDAGTSLADEDDDEDALMSGGLVFDAAGLDQDYEQMKLARKTTTKKRRARDASVSDMLFDARDTQSHGGTRFISKHVEQGAPVQMPDLFEASPPTDGSLANNQIDTSLQLSETHVASRAADQQADVSNIHPNTPFDQNLTSSANVDSPHGANRQDEQEASAPSNTAGNRLPPRQPFAPTATVGQAGPLSPNAPLARDGNGDVIFFWTDAHDMRVNGGEHLYLFGKAPVGKIDSGVYTSVCIQVQGIERALYVLPRKILRGSTECSAMEVDIIKHVHPEISKRLLASNAASASGARLGWNRATNQPASFRAKVVERCCPFGDHDAPRDPTKYLKVKFPFDRANPLTCDSAGDSFKRVYGCKTSASETLCLKRGLKGPCWLRISSLAPLAAKVSHARHSLFVTSPKSISVASDLSDKPCPSVSVLVLNTKTCLNSRTGVHEIVMIAGMFIPSVPLDTALDPACLNVGTGCTRDFVLMRAPDGKAVPFGFADRARALGSIGGGNIEIVPNEAALLNNLIGKLMRLDPDAVLGHDILGFGLDILLSRMAERRTRGWSSLGRLVQRRDLNSVVRNSSATSWFKAEAVAGRLICDTYSAAREILYKEKDYSLAALSASVLGATAGDRHFLPASTDVDLIPIAFETTDRLCHLVSECTLEARTAGRLAARLSILPLTKQLTCLSGNLWSQTLQGARAQRIEFLLCHEFRRIGSKKAGSLSTAGNVHGKVLLPDKLNKMEREKLAHLRNSESANHTRKVARKRNDSVAVENRLEVDTDGGEWMEDGKYAPEHVPSLQSNSVGMPKTSRRKPQYSGGLVLEPRKGLYDRFVLQLDFNSLYPSIIQEFNICFTTVRLGDTSASGAGMLRSDATVEGGCSEAQICPGEDGVDKTSTCDLLPASSVAPGVLPRVLRDLVSQRRSVKMRLKRESDPVLRSQLDIRQTAIKLTANSLYGCLGFENSRFHAQMLASLVTTQGRDTLQKTVDLARDSFGAQVIYGDTDSLFVYTGLDDISRVRTLGMELKKAVNERYKTLEIEIDAIYSKMLLLKKKKYAALKVVNPAKPDVVEREVKGLDLVRHDWCDLSHDASEHFLGRIFASSTANTDEAILQVLTFLEELAGLVRGNRIALAKYIITKSLTKDPDQYPDAKNLPHVQVALRLRKSGRRVCSGDYIKYVVCNEACEGGDRVEKDTSGAPTANVPLRAYHPDEIISSRGRLSVDTEYYLENQVLPPVLRLCDPIESIDAIRLASALGLKLNKYTKREHVEHASTDPEAFRDVTPMTIACPSCNVSGEFRGAQFTESSMKSNGLCCAHCNARWTSAMLQNVTTLHVRKWITTYYSKPFILSGDGARSREIRDVVLDGNAALITRQCDEKWLYEQLRYLRHLTDVQARWRNTYRAASDDAENPLPQEDALIYEVMLARTSCAFDKNAYRLLDLSQFLAPLGLT